MTMPVVHEGPGSSFTVTGASLLVVAHAAILAERVRLEELARLIGWDPEVSAQLDRLTTALELLA